MDDPLGANVNARGRLFHDEESRAGREPAADENLLLIAAAQPINERRPVARTHIEPIQHAGRFAGFPSPVNRRERAAGYAAYVWKEVLAQRHAAQRALTQSVACEERNSFSDARPDRQAGRHDVGPQPDRSAVLWMSAKNRAADRLVPCPAQAHETNHFSLSDGEGERPLIAGKKVLDLQERRGGAGAGGRLMMQFEISAKHVAYDGFRRRVANVARSDKPAVAQDRDAVDEAEQFIQAVAHVEDARSCGA